MGQLNENPKSSKNQNNKLKNNKIRIILLGDKNVGKTTFLKKISKEIKNKDNYFESVKKTYSFENNTYKISIYAIKKDINSKTTIELIKAQNFDGALFIFDNNDNKSFKNIEKYRNLFANDFPAILIQNKCDSDDSEDFSSTYFTDKIPQNNFEILRHKKNKENDKFYFINSFKTSALNGNNIKNSIHYLIDYIIHLKKIKITEVENKWNLIEDNVDENNENQNKINDNNNNNNENIIINEIYNENLLEKEYLKIIVITDDKNFSNDLVKNWESKYKNENFEEKLVFNYFDKKYCFYFEIFDNNEKFLKNIQSNVDDVYFGLYFIFKNDEKKFFNYCKNFEKIIKIIPNLIVKIEENEVNFQKKEEFTNVIKNKNFNEGICVNIKNNNEIFDSLEILLKKIVLTFYGKNNFDDIKEEIRNSLRKSGII